MIVAWTTMVECASGIARVERDDLIDAKQAADAFLRLDDVARGWLEVEPAGEIREIARRLLRAHRLRAGDAIQIASATLAAERRPATLEFVTLDDRLEAAAVKEGFPVVVPGR
jgi:predicted nucleic acid-binding protein